MEKILNAEKSGSFPRFGRRRSKLETSSFKLENFKPKEADENQITRSNLEHGVKRDHMLEQVDQFIENLASARDKSITPEIPDLVEQFLKMVDYRIGTYEMREASVMFGQNQEEDSMFFEAVNRLSKIVSNLDEFILDSETNGCFNRAGSILHHAMSLLENEFVALLDVWKRSCNVNIMDSKTPKIMDSKTPKTPKQSVFDSNPPEMEIEFPYFTSESISVMNRVATAMIFAGYQPECCVAYTSLRLKALDAEFCNQGYENINMEEFQRMEWASQEREIENWIHIVNYCTANLFPVERQLCNSIFEHASTAQRLFGDLATSLTIKLLNFPNALLLIKQYSTEKLFKFLDIYETLCELISGIGNDLSAKDLIPDTSITQRRIGEAAVSIFCELENSIKSDNGRIPVANGAVHPLTRYTMNYLKYACEYKDTLEQVFRQHNETEGSTEQEPKNATEGNGESISTSHFATQLRLVMDLLDANIDMKSNLYKEPSLRYIFLMNNGRYMLQKVKSSTDIFKVTGDDWSRKRSSDLRQYHKNYQRETWSKVLQCMSHEGLQVNGKVSKSILKERFKSFNAMFDEIHKTQCGWMVSDEQLKSELRVSISAVVIPAYRSFLGRFSSHLDTGKQQQKYIKYQAEEIEGLIDELFEGTVTSMGRRRHIHLSHGK
ncbi:exocyst subunit exo70 family protein C1 [Hibiscus trionum]|uniref:Exocyst subunit Exo70 family protein n=1 Tax=Hibiscus trionum TaxID=183268 RepID=A0A9W7H7B4_HIBTR|nr:exocyst subunit exo70 family protein C1 [Hibiscus trionum]